MKKLIIITTITVIFIAAISITGCKRDVSLDDVLPDSSALISFTVPEGWPQPIYTFNNNKLTQQGFELGRKLFYDVRLSKDKSVSCGSCHQQFAGFAHLDHPLSHGINGLFGLRNSQGIFNMAWKPAFFWDGGVINIENQPINPIENPVEMGNTVTNVVNDLSSDAGYKMLFAKAFGDETINSQRIFKALAQFMAAMVSSNSKYDKYIRKEAGGEFTEQELRGLTLFREKCASCHKEPLMSDFSYRNNGLAPDIALNDTGRAHITADAADRYKFMVPSLRNIDLSRPYMHDGRFNTLDAVLEHYRSGIMASENLDPSLKDGIEMTDQEKADIISFLKTLSDNSFTKDKRFSEPI